MWVNPCEINTKIMLTITDFDETWYLHRDYKRYQKFQDNTVYGFRVRAKPKVIFLPISGPLIVTFTTITLSTLIFITYKL